MDPRSPYHAVFGQATKALRKEAKLTQAQVAERMEVPATFVSDIERGVRNISLSTQLSLADALGVKLAAIVNRADRIESRG
jgi:transcriptional regulator with XRE-family HTH domain